jgi:hypothetical protein
MAQTNRLILRYERNLVEAVDETFGLPPTLTGPAFPAHSAANANSTFPFCPF